MLWRCYANNQKLCQGGYLRLDRAGKSKVIATVAARSSSCNDNPTTNCLGLLPMKVDSDPALEV